MPFACPDCRRAELRIGPRIELPSDSRSDEIAVQILECGDCGFRGAAVYEESRRGALDSESWEHSGYRMAEGDLDALAARIEQCPKPTDRRCPCAAHRTLGRRDSSGRWAGLKGLKRRFPMRPADTPPASPDAPSGTPAAPAPAPRSRVGIGRKLRKLVAVVLLTAGLFVGGMAGGLIGAQAGDEAGAAIGAFIGLFVFLFLARVFVAVIQAAAAPRPVPQAPPAAPDPRAEEARQLALRKLAARERAVCLPSSPQWTSYTGYDYAREGHRGFSLAQGVLRETQPLGGESPQDYLSRVMAHIRTLRDEARSDAADEDGARSGALDEALSAIRDALAELPDRP